MQGKPAGLYLMHSAFVLWAQQNPSGQKMDMATVKKLAISTATATSLLMGAAFAANAQDDARLKNVVKEVSDSKKVAIATQKSIESLSNKTADLFAEYKVTLKAIDGLEAYNALQKRTIQRQLADIAELEASIAKVAGVKNQIPGIMKDMIANLKEFVDNDIPFQHEERKARVAKLTDYLTDPSFADPERFRVILEAYKSEVTYGRSITAWSGEVDGRAVNFVRVGRIGYYYQTTDATEAKAYYNGEWTDVDAAGNTQIRNLLKMANKQAPFNPLVLPIAAAN